MPMSALRERSSGATEMIAVAPQMAVPMNINADSRIAATTPSVPPTPVSVTAAPVLAVCLAAGHTVAAWGLAVGMPEPPYGDEWRFYKLLAGKAPSLGSLDYSISTRIASFTPADEALTLAAV